MKSDSKARRASTNPSLLVALVAALVLSACSVRRYNETPFTYDPVFVRIVPVERLMDEGRSENWKRTFAICYRARAEMQREADELTRRNRLVGSAFAALTGIFALSATVYSTLDEEPNPRAITLLSLGATSSTVPTFFYFGEDERGSELRARMGRVDQAMASANDAYSRLLAADRARAGAGDENVLELRLEEAKDALDVAIRDLANVCN